MSKITNNEKGFSAVEGLLILVIVAVVGFVGWYVNNTNKKTNSTYNATTQSSQSTPTMASPIAGRLTYKAADGTFSVKYPKELLTKDCPSASNGTFFGLASTPEGLLQRCDAQPIPPYGSVIKFTSYPLPPNFDPKGTDSFNRQAREGETSYKYSMLKLNGHKVEKSTTVLSNDSPVIPGATTTTYRYYNDKDLWEAVHTQLPGQKDLSTQFELMVKSWRF